MPTVTITVTRNGIMVRPDPVEVPRKQKKVAITWRIKTAGWTFADHGIEISKNNY